MSEVNPLKNPATNSRIPIYGGILGLVLCILIASVCGFSYLFAFGDLRIQGLQDIDAVILLIEQFLPLWDGRELSRVRWGSMG